MARPLINRLRPYAKATYQRLRYSANTAKTIGLILGVQRSGTNMLMRAFDNDWACKVFGEDGGLAQSPSSGTHVRWRWKPYIEVAEILRRQRAPLLIAKPLVESQWADKLLQAITGARIIWAYRHYQDVAISGQEHFGSETIRYNLTSILENRAHWYAENVPGEASALVQRYYHAGRSEFDLRALGWCVRNTLLFRYDHLPITLARYEDLVSVPAKEMRRLYDFLGFRYPGDRIVAHIHTRSVKRGKDVDISSDIRELCDEMLFRLDQRASSHL